MSSSDDEPPRRGASQSMKSIFAADQRAASHGNQSLKYERKKRTDDPAVAPGSAPAPGAQQTFAPCSAPVVAYRGDEYVGPCMIAVSVGPAVTNVVIVDKERRGHCKVKVDDGMQLLPSAQDTQYATLYDPITQVHWSLMFRSSSECAHFVASALTIQHYMLLPDGPRSPVIDLVESADGVAAANGDTVHVSFINWMLKRVGSAFTCGKLIEEVPEDAPRPVVLGDGAVMVGVEEALIGARSGSWKLVIVPPRKTKQHGLGNPEIGPKDNVVALVRVHKVLSDNDEPKGNPPPRADSPPPREVARIQDREQPAPAQQREPTSPPPAAAPAASGEDALMKMLLVQSLQTLQQAHQQHMQPPPAPPPPPQTDAVPAHVERSLDRINQQLSSLYEKIDRLDFEKRLEQNNEKLERMVKKAVGKLPVTDVDIEDQNKSQGELLASIEHLKARLEEMTDRYHQALHAIGGHKDQVAALKNDLAIERDTAQRTQQETKERHRLQIVEAEVHMRQAVDDARESALKDGREEGYKEGYDAGRLDAMSDDGGASLMELREQVSAKEQEIVSLQSRNAELEARMYDERRKAGDAQQSLRALIDKMEKKEQARQGVIYDDATAAAKMLRRVMNSTFASVEEQFYATEQQSIEVADALNMVLVAIKSETRSAIDELKRDAAARATDPVPRSQPAEDVVVSPTPQDPPPMPAPSRFGDGELGAVTRGQPETHAAAAHAEYNGALSSAIAMPSGDEDGMASLDEIAAYLASRGSDGGDEGETES